MPEMSWQPERGAPAGRASRATRSRFALHWQSAREAVGIAGREPDGRRADGEAG